MLFWDPHQVTTGRTFVQLRDFEPGVETVLKVEGLNPAGSLKIVPAREMIASAERRGVLAPGASLIESTSGNFGIALAGVCAAKGFRVTLVTDPNTNEHSTRHMKALGAEIVTVTDRDSNGGFLQTRIDFILRRIAQDPTLVWLNQYANEANPRAHRTITAVEIEEEFGIPDWLFVGVGSTGTLMGCVDHFRSINASTRIVGVDAVGSVTFGGAPAARHIPGLGTSRTPEIFVDDDRFERCVVEESETIRICRQVARRYGLLLGGSTGTALAALRAMRGTMRPRCQVVVISPDLGDRYLDTIYDDDWVLARYGPTVLSHIRSGSGVDRPGAPQPMPGPSQAIREGR